MPLARRPVISLPVPPVTGSLEAVVAPAGIARSVAAITRVIDRRTAGRVQELRVEVTGDTVLLTGRCATFHIKQLAQHAAMDLVWGAPIVNTIEVVE